MTGFFKTIWVFVRPYQGRLILGLICGIIYALVNTALVLVIKVVVSLVFPGSEHQSLAQLLGNAPPYLRPLVESLTSWLPELKSPSSKLGLALVIASIPLIMFLRGVFSYLNIYLTNWAAM